MGRQQGFTIVEVMLFLAISAAIFMIAMYSMTRTLGDVRFRDATNSVESYIERQYTNVQTNGVTKPTFNTSQTVCSPIDHEAIRLNSVAASSADSRGNSATCVLLGVELLFETVGDQSRIRTYPILGYAEVDTTDSTLEALKSSNPRVLAFIDDAQTVGSVETFDIPWGASISSLPTAVAGSDYNAVAIMRSPSSEAINLFFHTIDNPDNIANVRLSDFVGLSTDPAPSLHRNIPALLCLQMSATDNMRGGVLFDGQANSQHFGIGSISSAVRPTTEAFSAEQGLSCS